MKLNRKAEIQIVMEKRLWDRRSVGARLSTLIALAGIYLGAARLGLFMAFEETNASPVWPPTGIALAAVLLFGYQVWPGIALGAFLANVVTFVANGQHIAPSILMSGIICVGNTLEAILGAFLLRRFVGTLGPIGRARNVFKFIVFAALLATTVSATVGVFGLYLGNVADRASFGYLWWTWWVGDAVGALVVTPILLVWIELGWPGGRWRPRRMIEAGLLCGLLAGMSWLACAAPLGITSIVPYRLEYLVIPIVVWITLRFGWHGAVTSVLLTTVITVWSTAQGVGPFAVGSPNDSLLLLQTYLAVVTVTALTLAGALAGRRRAEEALQESERRYRTLFEQANDAIFLINESDEIIDVNQRACQLLGYTREKLLTMKVTDLQAPEIREREGSVVKRELEQYAGAPFESVDIHQNGTPIPVEVSTSRFTAQEGGLVLSIVRDITERKQAGEELERYRDHLEELVEERTRELVKVNERLEQEIAERRRTEKALRESQARFQDLYENAPSAYFSVGADGAIRRCNRRAGQLLGYSVDELVGRSVLDLYTDTPQGREKASKTLQRFRAGEAIDDEQLQMQKADGTPVWISLTVNLVRDASGRVAESRSIAVDITERKQAEERIKELAEFPSENPTPVMRVAHDGTILYANAASQPLLDLWQCRMGECLSEDWGRHISDVVDFGLRKNMEVEHGDRTFFLAFAPIPGAGYVNVYGFDITERKKTERALRRRNQELALLNQVSRDLTATLDLQQVAEQSLRAVTETIGAEDASVWLWDEEEEGWLVCQAAFHRGQALAPVNRRLRPGQGVAGWVAQEGESVIITNTADDPRFFAGIDEQTGFRTTALIAVPLWVRRAVIGILEVVNKQRGEFDTDDLALVETIAASAAIAIDNAQLIGALRQHTVES